MADTPFKARNGLDVLGNITISGTVDGRDIATDGTKLDTVATNANNYTLPTATASVLGGIKVGSGLSISSGVLSATGGGDTVYTPDVWEIATATGKSSDSTLALGSTTAIIAGTTATTRLSDTELQFDEAGIYEITYQIAMEQGAPNTSDVRQNPAVYVKAGAAGSLNPVDGSLNVAYIRLQDANQAPYGSVCSTFYYDARVSDRLELWITWIQAATNKDIDIIAPISGLSNTISIRKIK